MGEQERIYREAISKGHEAAWDLEWERAAKWYQKALEVRPDDFQALVSLGLAYLEMGQLDAALRCYVQAARQQPHDPVPWEKLTEIYERRGEVQQAERAALQAAEAHARRKDVTKAIENWLRVVRLNPENLIARSRLALVYERTKRTPEAAQEYVAVASILQRQGRLKEAEQALAQAVRLMPQLPEVQRARALWQQGKPLPPPPRVRGGTGPLRMARIRQMEARQRQEGVAEEEGAPPALDPIAEARQKALTMLAELLFDEAEAMRSVDSTTSRRRSLDALIAGMPTSPEARQAQRQKVLLLLGQAVDLQTQGNHEQAAVELEQALKAGLEHPVVHFDLGLLLSEGERLESAIRHLKRTVLHPDYALASHLLLGRIYTRQGRTREAAQAYLAALREADAAVLSTEEAEAVRQLYEPVLASLEDADEATCEQVAQAVEEMLSGPDWREKVQHAREQLSPAPEGAPPRPLAELVFQAESARVVEALARVSDLRRRGRLNAAMEEAHLALRWAPTYLPLHVVIGEMLEEQGLTEQAKEKYAAVARAYSFLGQGDVAVAMYQRALRLDPMDLNLRMALIEILVNQERLGEAVSAYVDLAEAYYRLAELRLAEDTFKEALRLTMRMGGAGRSWREQILRRLADLAEQALDWAKAARYYEQLRTLDPGALEVRQRLATLYLRSGQVPRAIQELDDALAQAEQQNQSEQMLSWLEELVDAFPQEGEVLMRLGRVYARQGKTEQAIAAYDRAGEIFLERDDVRSAIRAVQAILALNPPQAEEYRQALAALQAQLGE